MVVQKVRANNKYNLENINGSRLFFHQSFQQFLEFLKKQLDDYVASNLPKVRVLHIPPPRQGLMAARTLGATNSTGEVLIFADAHLEVNVNWLPPLLGAYIIYLLSSP